MFLTFYRKDIGISLRRKVKEISSEKDNGSNIFNELFEIEIKEEIFDKAKTESELDILNVMKIKGQKTLAMSIGGSAEFIGISQMMW